MRANARFLSGFTSHSDEIRVFSKFCTRRFAPYICILLTANLHGAAAFHSPFGHTCSNRTERIRLTLAQTCRFLPSQSFALVQTCQRAAPSVTACAVPPSSGRKALVFRAIHLVSPFGRDVAQRQRGLAPSLRELDCRLAARLREFYKSDKIRMRFDLIRTCQRAALSVICFANASSPKGRAKKPVRAAHQTHQANFCADLPARCSFRHGLRRATFLREEGFCFTRNPPCLSLWERCRAATERAGSLFEGAGFAAGKD